MKNEAWRFRIEKLTLAPGDTLVAQLDETTSRAQMQVIREYLETCAPTGVAVLMIGTKVKLSVLGK